MVASEKVTLPPEVKNLPVSLSLINLSFPPEPLTNKPPDGPPEKEILESPKNIEFSLRYKSLNLLEGLPIS